MASKTSSAKVSVALPKSNEGTGPGAAVSTSPIAQDSALYSAIGGRIRVTTSSNSTVEGTLYTADALTSFLIIQLSASSNAQSITPSTLAAPAGSYRLIPFSQISSFSILSQGPTSSSQQEAQPTPQIDTAAATSRLNTAINTAQTALSRQGPKGTSPRDQALFDALARTHPARWEGTVMVISDSFQIEKPYSSATTKDYAGGNVQTNGSGGNNGFRGDLQRFRTIVDMELKKAEFRINKVALDARVTTSPGAGDEERKGG